MNCIAVWMYIRQHLKKLFELAELRATEKILRHISFISGVLIYIQERQGLIYSRTKRGWEYFNIIWSRCLRIISVFEESHPRLSILYNLQKDRDDCRDNVLQLSRESQKQITSFVVEYKGRRRRDSPFPHDYHKGQGSYHNNRICCRSSWLCEQLQTPVGTTQDHGTPKSTRKKKLYLRIPLVNRIIHIARATCAASNVPITNTIYSMQYDLHRRMTST